MRKILMVVTFLNFVSFNFAQIKESGVIQGNVYDTEGKPLSQATVVLAGVKLVGGVRETLTDENGFYRFYGIPAGYDYDLTVMKEGFETFKKGKIYVHPNTTSIIDFSLSSAGVFETGAIHGIVNDSSGNPVSGILVFLNGEKIKGETRKTVTDDTGYFRFSPIPVGSDYTVSLKFGDQPLVKEEQVSVLSNSVTTVNLSIGTGVVQGNVYDIVGNPIPKASVILENPRIFEKPKTTLTDANGFFNFSSIPIGFSYTVKVQIEGFKSSKKEGIYLTSNSQEMINFNLETVKIAEEKFLESSVVVDPKSSFSPSNIVFTNDVLRNIPNTQFTTNIIRLAPGVTPTSDSFGGASSSANSYLIDGLETSDPEGGSPWVFMDYQAVQEVQILNAGLPAEFGGFTGAVLNAITKSGGSKFEVYNEFLFQDSNWTSDNLKKFKPEELYNPSPFKITDIKDFYKSKSGLTDFNIHIGGPLRKNNLYFFFGAQYYQSNNFPSGFDDSSDQGVVFKQPRLFLKISYELSQNDRLSGFIQNDHYNGLNVGASYNIAKEATVTQMAPEWVFNINYTHVFSPKTYFDVKLGGFWGYYYLEPSSGRDTIGYVDEYGYNTGNSVWWYMANRFRSHVNANLSHYADNFIKGSHDFKFGVEIEKDWNQSLYGYTGGGDSKTGLPKSAWVFTYRGKPYLAYQWEGYDQHISLTRFSTFFQDSWILSKRFTINAGVRYDIFRGAIVDKTSPFSSLFPKSEIYWLSPPSGKPKELGTIYKPSGISPRFGFSFDVFGDKKTLVKAHYGRYYEALFAASFMLADPRYKDSRKYSWIGTRWVLDEEGLYPWSEGKYSVDPKIKHPHMDEITFGIEREIFKNASIGLAFIQRNYTNMIGALSDAEFVEKEILDLGPDGIKGTGDDKKVVVYEQLNPSKEHFLITNPKAGMKNVILGKDPYRKYTAFELIFNKRFSNRWQLLFSYVYSKTKSNMDTDWSTNTGNTVFFENPNYQLNADGIPTVDPTHQIKIQGSYVLPRFGILPFDLQINAYYFYQTGNTYTRIFTTPYYHKNVRIRPFAEPRGSRRLDSYNNLDIRLETQFNLFKGKLGLIFDMFNVLNYAGVRGRYVRTIFRNPKAYPGVDSAFLGSQFDRITSIDQGRSFRLGIRYSF
ncbi:MAG: TonB-dependent receptor [Candidatus Aminicenantia bacterium]